MPVRAEIIIHQDVVGEIAKIPTKELQVTEKFIAGNHWQGGDMWTGWKPESTSQDAINQFKLVESLFNPKNVCGGMVKRVRGASLGKEPDWEVMAKGVARESDPDKEKERVKTTDEKYFAEVDKFITRWWELKKVHQKLKDFVSNKAAYGKAAIRIYIPPAYVKNGTDGKATISASTLEDMLDMVYVDVPHYSTVINALDVERGQEFTILKVAKVNENDPDTYEICYLNEDGKTCLRQVSETADKKLQGIDLGGSLLTYIAGEYTDAMISETVKQQQKAVNHAKTGENFALENINFPETTFLNANLPTEKETDSSGKSVETVRTMAQGPGRWRSLAGYVLDRIDGSQAITEPKVIYRDGADPKKFAEVADNNTRDMHQEAGMLYIYLADSEYASGNARVEAMTDYLILLTDHKTMIDTLGVWLLSTVLRLAYNFVEKDKADKFEVVFSSKLTIGRIGNEDKKTMLEEVAKGLRSQRNYMVTAEVTDDPTSELKAIALDAPLKDAPPDPIELAKAQAAVKPVPVGGNGSGAPAVV